MLRAKQNKYRSPLATEAVAKAKRRDLEGRKLARK